MSGYIGVEPVPLASQVVYEEIFDEPFQVVEIPGGYTVGNIEVFVNGIFLHPNGYTADNGTSVDLGVSFDASPETPFEFYVKEVRQYLDVDARDPTKLAIDENLSEIASNGPAAQAEAQTNIGLPLLTDGPINFDNFFNTGQFYCSRLGNQVTITTTDLVGGGTPGTDTRNTSNGLIPVDFRPSNDVFFSHSFAESPTLMTTVIVRIDADGSITFHYRDGGTGEAIDVTSDYGAFSWTFLIT